ncbi:hypothetical protein K9M74_01390 [Candidatus Woesearchaeota archaeon]|nr:hypothetical protein [Candidatus Woesearchaeota archaeon]
MIPLLKEQLIVSLVHAAQQPHVLSQLEPRLVTHVQTKNAHRIHRFRQKKTKPNSRVTKISSPEKKRTVIHSIAEEITLARVVAKELYEDQEITEADWRATKAMLKKLSTQLMQKKIVH